MFGAGPLHLRIAPLPLSVLKSLLRLLLVSSNALPLDLHQCSPVNEGYTPVQPSVLRVSRLFYITGLPILYGENIITTTRSYSFDARLLALRPRNRQMITSIRLEIDWADHLWAKFPLIALQLSQLRQLQKLDIVIIHRKKPEHRTILMERDPNHTNFIGHGPDKGMRREGSLADTMLKAEKKILKDLVERAKDLKVFKLEGFRDPVFAKQLSFDNLANSR